MKVKDLIGINPEAEIRVGFANTGMLYTGKISYGWSTDGDCEPGTDTKSTTKEVCIFLGDIDENKA